MLADSKLHTEEPGGPVGGLVGGTVVAGAGVGPGGDPVEGVGGAGVAAVLEL